MTDITLNYRESGTGRPVIILHGLFGSSRNWHSMSRKLADHFRVINVDLRNHGQSPHSETMSYPEMAEDVFMLAESLGLEDYTLIGHSMGGKVAMQMALSRPASLENFIVLDIAPVKYPHRYGKLFTSMYSLPLETMKSRGEIESHFCPAIGDMMLCRFLLQNLERSDNGFSWRINLAALENNMDTIATFPEFPSSRFYDGPCLFLGGSESDFILSEHIPAIKQLFPEADIQWLKNTGHMLHIEQPDTVFNEIRQFINK